MQQLKYNSKTDGLEEDTLASPVKTTRHFESPSVGLALIFFSTSFCTPNMPTMKWNVT